MTAAVARTGVDHDAADQCEAGSAGGGTATGGPVIAARCERFAGGDPGAIARGGYDPQDPFP